MTTPLWLLEVMIKYLPALEADAQRSAVVAATAPHYKRDSYRSLLGTLDRAARALDPPRVPVEPMEKIADDPEAAAEWFEAQGLRVVRSA